MCVCSNPVIGLENLTIYGDVSIFASLFSIFREDRLDSTPSSPLDVAAHDQEMGNVQADMGYIPGTNPDDHKASIIDVPEGT